MRQGVWLRAKPVNRLDNEKQDFHKSVYAAFDKIAKENPERVQRINANQDIDAVQADIQSALQQR